MPTSELIAAIPVLLVSIAGLIIIIGSIILSKLKKKKCKEVK